jgi:hypothetical protein
MNDKQNSKLNMYQATSDICHRNEGIYTQIPACVNIVSELDQHIDAIRKTEQEQITAKVQGVTQEKYNKEDKMVALSVTTANVLYVYAYTSNQPELLAKVNVNKSKFYQLESNEELALAQTIRQQAKNLFDSLRPFGLTPELLDQLDDSIRQFSEWIEKPRETIIDHKKHTANLRRLFVDVDSILYDKLDKLMRLFKEEYPDFYYDYVSARNIINTSVRHKKES